ncbi:CRISPR-associated endonuclease Cas9 [Candidatus Hepatincola sp. Av]
MKYRVGIDVGTSSLGLVAYELATDSQGNLIYEKDDQGKDSVDPKVLSICHMDTVIFREPLNPKTNTLLNTTRRSKRSQRKLLKRSVHRRRKLFHLFEIVLASELPNLNQEDLHKEAENQWQKISSDEIFALRAKALTQKITLPELFRVLSHLNKNRGYRGDLRANGNVGKAIQESNKALRKKDNNGEYIKKLDENNEPIINKNNKGEPKKILQQDKEGNFIYKKDVNGNKIPKLDSKGKQKTSKKGEPLYEIEEDYDYQYELMTLGEYYYQQQQENKNTSKEWRVLTNNKDSHGTYVLRQIIEDEFNKIMKEQCKHYTILKESFIKLAGEDSLQYFQENRQKNVVTFKDALYESIFYQRPIRWDPDNIKNCNLTGEKVAAKVSLAFQKWRIEAKLNNLILKPILTKEESDKLREQVKDLPEKERKRIYTEAKKERESARPVRPLNDDEKDKLRKFLNKNAFVSFKDIYTELNIDSNMYRFTHDRTKIGEENTKNGLIGNKTLAFFNSTKLQEDPTFKEAVELWETLTTTEKEVSLQFLSLMANTDELYETKEEIEEKIKKIFEEQLKLTKEEHSINNVFNFLDSLKDYEKFTLLPKMVIENGITLDSGRAQYSIQAIRKLLPHIIAGEKEEDARKKEFPNVNNNKSFEELLKDVTNPVVKRSLKELKRVLNYTYHKLGGKPEFINIELSREMKNPVSKRKEIENDNKNRREERAKYAEKLADKGIPISKNKITKYRLWEEQGYKDAYTGKPINVEDFFKTEIDHIIPKTQGGGNALYNLVLTSKEINNNKTNYTPFQAKEIPAMKDLGFNWEWIETLAKKYKEQGGNEEGREKKPSSEDKTYFQKKAKLLLTKEHGEGVGEDFMERANTETAFIGRVLTNWLQNEIKKENVQVSRGYLTAYLRQHWELENILAEIRIEENKPLITQKINKPEFLPTEKWRKYQELQKAYLDSNKAEDKKKEKQEFLGKTDPIELQWYKRADHRHHLVDAAIIGLTTRSLLQKASTIYAKGNKSLKAIAKKDDGKVVREGFYPTVPLPALKSLLRERLKDYVVWHKPDRYPDMSLFQDTPYSLEESNKPDNQKYLINRKPLSNLLIKAKNEKAKNKEDVIKKINDLVVGEELKHSIIKQFEIRYEKLENENDTKDKIDKNKTEDLLKLALCGENDEDGIFFPENIKRNKVKKVRMYFKKNGRVKYNPEGDSCKQQHTESKSKTIYIGDGYSCACVYKSDGNKWQGKPITKLQAIKLHKDNKLIDTDNSYYLYPNDLVYSEEKKEFYVIQSFSTKGGINLLLTTEPFSFGDNQGINSQVLKHLKETSESEKDYLNKIKEKDFYKIIGWKNVADLKPVRTRVDIAKIKKDNTNV